MSHDRLRAGDLAAPHRGVRIRATDVGDLLARCRAALLIAPSGARLSHVTALRLAGAEVPFELMDDDVVHLEVDHPDSRTRARGIVGHRRVTSRPRQLAMVRGLPSVAPAAAWAQMARVLTVRDLVAVGDALIRRKSPITTIAALLGTARMLDARAPGSRAIGEALSIIKARTDSCMESYVRWELVTAGLPCPEVNIAVRQGGRLIAMPDMSYPELKIAIEYDGDVHRTDRRTWRRDVARRQALEALGWRMVTATADDALRQPARLIGWVLEARRSQAARPSVSE